jgi:7-cyano-7-deazaguanine synthase
MKVVVLLSGGVDSTACLAYYRRQRRQYVSALHVNYGQSARVRELRAARAVSAHYGVRLRTIRVSATRALDGYIPARNALLLTLALMHFGSGSGLVSLGIHAGTRYADCTPDFVRAMQAVFDVYAQGTVVIDAPFVEWRKGDIWRYLQKRRAPIRLTYSCELGKRQPCGTCPSCHDIQILGADAR